MSRNSGGGIVTFSAILIILALMYASGMIEISGLNAFQTGFSLQPLLNLGNQVVAYISSITGISTVLIVLVLMSLVLYGMAQKRR